MKRKFPDISISLHHTPWKTLAKFGSYRLFHELETLVIITSYEWQNLGIVQCSAVETLFEF